MCVVSNPPNSQISNAHLCELRRAAQVFTRPNVSKMAFLDSNARKSVFAGFHVLDWPPRIPDLRLSVIHLALNPAHRPPLVK